MGNRTYWIVLFVMMFIVFTGCGGDDDDESCMADCSNKECGDDGCGGSCGTCPDAAPFCTDAGLCVESCTPSCAGKECGGDGCGGSCGTCPGTAPICNDFGQCVFECIADCTGRECGTDGCGGSCGTCPDAAPNCSKEGLCYADCVPDCTGKECGDNGCDGSCGTCTNGICLEGVCGCETNDDCDENSICYQDQCVTAYGREYRLTFESAQISENKSDNSDWDTLGGMPDPFVSYKFDDEEGNTATVDDTLQPEWDDFIDVVLSQTQTIVMTVMDEDLSDHDEIAKIELNQIPVEDIKKGHFTRTNVNESLLEFVMKIEPK